MKTINDAGFTERLKNVFTLSDNENTQWNDRARHISIFIAARDHVSGMYSQGEVCSAQDHVYPACDRCIAPLLALWGTDAQKVQIPVCGSPDTADLSSAGKEKNRGMSQGSWNYAGSVCNMFYVPIGFNLTSHGS